MRCFCGKYNLPRLIGFAVDGSAGDAPYFEPHGIYGCKGAWEGMDPSKADIFSCLRRDFDLAFKLGGAEPARRG